MVPFMHHSHQHYHYHFIEPYRERYDDYPAYPRRGTSERRMRPSYYDPPQYRPQRGSYYDDYEPQRYRRRSQPTAYTYWERDPRGGPARTRLGYGYGDSYDDAPRRRTFGGFMRTMFGMGSSDDYDTY